MERFANNAQSTLASGISAGATSLSVVDPSKFPGSPNFRLLIDSEYVLVTAIPGAYTVTRGIEGSTAASHAAGATVTQILTVGGLAQWLTDSVQTVEPLDGHLTLAVDLVAGDPTLTFTSIWGIDGSGDPYLDTGGAASGEDALLVMSPTGALVLVQPPFDGGDVALAADLTAEAAARAAADDALQDAIDAAGSGATELYVQEAEPTAAAPWQWWELNPDQSLKTLWVNVP